MMMKELEKSDKDPLFADAARLVVKWQDGSFSLLQRYLRLGYMRAGMIMEQLEHYKIVGAFNGSKPRDVLVKSLGELEEHLNKLL